MLDKSPGLCYYNYRKREGKPTKPERNYKMNACEIIARLNELDFIMEGYEKAGKCYTPIYGKYSEEYHELTEQLKAMGVRRPLYY